MSAEARRELWLGVALSVARDGLPAPKNFEFLPDDGGVWLGFWAASDAARWGEALQLDLRDVVASDDHLIHRWSGDRGGVWWSVNATERKADDAEPSDQAQSLAGQVVDAIVNDRPQETIVQAEAASPLNDRTAIGGGVR